jgi:hypothetical protein
VAKGAVKKVVDLYHVNELTFADMESNTKCSIAEVFKSCSVRYDVCFLTG